MRWLYAGSGLAICAIAAAVLIFTSGTFCAQSQRRSDTYCHELGERMATYVRTAPRVRTVFGLYNQIRHHLLDVATLDFCRAKYDPAIRKDAEQCARTATTDDAMERCYLPLAADLARAYGAEL